MSEGEEKIREIIYCRKSRCHIVVSTQHMFARCFCFHHRPKHALSTPLTLPEPRTDMQSNRVS